MFLSGKQIVLQSILQMGIFLLQQCIGAHGITHIKTGYISDLDETLKEDYLDEQFELFELSSEES